MFIAGVGVGPTRGEYHMKISLGDFNAEVGRERIYFQTNSWEREFV
jgi:hypothetical protein